MRSNKKSCRVLRRLTEFSRKHLTSQMNLPTTLGILLLLASLRPQGTVAATLLFRAQETPASQNPPEPQDHAKPDQSDNTAPAAPPADSAGSTENPGQGPQPAVPEIVNPKPGPPKKRSSKKPGRKHPDRKSNGIVVVRNGGTSNSQGPISSGITVQQAPEQLKKTNSLLKATASNLQVISGKELNPSQQEMVKQIRSYMQQSKNAAVAGDVQGANNLAFKAHLLSEELVKHPATGPWWRSLWPTDPSTSAAPAPGP